jgi:CDGSH-type Zn-finger protein
LNEPVKKIVKKKKPGNTQLQILKNGPILLTGNFVIFDAEKKKIKVITETVALCRCGVSKTKPFCDGHHLAVKFEG